MIKVKNFIEDFFVYARAAIIKYESFKELTGDQKKDRVDQYMKDMILQAINSVSCPIFFRWIIKTFIIQYIPMITQRIFDLIKDNVEGITNK